MQMYELQPHPSHPPLEVRSVQAKWGISNGWLQLRWRVDGSGRVKLPPLAGSRRKDGLWQTTCFELFTLGKVGAYSEFNLSPSEAWAAYDFTAWRDGMTERSISRAPVITPRKGRDTLIFDAALPMHDLPGLPVELSLTCVIEEEGGTKSFWAMAHGLPDRPDFHDPACFAATLAPPAQS